MNAKEMFEQLGYIDKTKTPNEIHYLKEDDWWIIFNLTSRKIFVGYGYDSGKFSIDELKAINKQVEELGWLESENQNE